MKEVAGLDYAAHHFEGVELLLDRGEEMVLDQFVQDLAYVLHLCAGKVIDYFDLSQLL